MKKFSTHSLFRVAAIASLFSCIFLSGGQSFAQSRDAKAPSVLDKAIPFPARFSLPEFFIIISQASGNRIVAPADDNDDLTAKLNASFAGKQFSLRDVYDKYFTVSGLAGYGQGTLTVIESPFLGSTADVAADAKELQARFANSASALALLTSLSKDQIDLMYRYGQIPVDLLTPEQRVLYIDFIRQTHLFDGMVKNQNGVVTDEDILKQTFKFNFYHTASFLVRKSGLEQTNWIGLYDYGTGLIWDSMATSEDDLPAANKTSFGGDKGRFVLMQSTNEQIVSFKDDQTLSIKETLDLLSNYTGKKIVADKRLTEEKLSQTKVVMTRGNYKLAELVDAVPATIGAELRQVDNILFLGVGDSLGRQRRQSRLEPQVKEAYQLLRRLPGVNYEAPFLPYLFDGRVTIPFSKLDTIQQTYIKGRLKNTQDESYAKLDLNQSQISFANTLWFSGLIGNPLTDPIIVTNIQVW